MITSDVLGIDRRKREEGDENEATMVEKEHRGLKNLRKRERVKLSWIQDYEMSTW
jgi:hypothetical protein